MKFNLKFLKRNFNSRKRKGFENEQLDILIQNLIRE